MKIVLAFDSFKGCLSSEDIIKTSTEAIRRIIPTAEIKGFIIADGGEGTLNALVYGINGKIIKKDFTNLEGKIIGSGIGAVNDICIIECAQTVGIPQSTRKNVEFKTSKGMGEQIKFALDSGFRKFVIGLGGSGTNDVGLGVIGELGYQFIDDRGNKVEPLLNNIHEISKIDESNVDKRIYDSEFTILSDVKNPLCGKSGATYVYGPQKGVREDQLEYFDKGIFKFSEIASRHFGFDKSFEKGAGAAGGLGYAFLQFFNGKTVSGIDYILEALNIREAIKNSDVVFTGEGKTDIQTANGKVAIGVAELAKQFGKPVILISGALSEDAYGLHEYGIDYLSSIQDYPARLEDVIEPLAASRLLAHRVEETVRLLLVGRKLTEDKE